MNCADSLVSEQQRFWDAVCSDIVTQQHRYDLRMICCYEKHRSLTAMDPRYTYQERDMVIMCQKTPHKMGMLAVGPYRFIMYITNLGLVAELEVKVGIVQKCHSPTSYLICLHPSKYILMNSKQTSSKNMQEGAQQAKHHQSSLLNLPLIFLARLDTQLLWQGGAEWSSSSSSIMLSDSDNEKLPSIVQWYDNAIALHLGKRVCIRFYSTLNITT